MSDNELRILLLGPPVIELQNRAIEFDSDIERTFLFCLASKGGAITRYELRNLLWHTETDANANHLFNQTLENIHTQLDRPGLISTSSGQVHLDLERVYIDQVAFQELVEQSGRFWKIPASEPLPSETFNRLLEAVNLWRGLRFMSGFQTQNNETLNQWYARTAHQLERALGRILARIAEHAYRVDDLEAALYWARLALLNDELSENLHAQVLRALIKMKRDREAREHFAYLENLLRREIDSTPGPSLVDLYRQVREPDQNRASLQQQPNWKVRPSAHVPLIGRDSELETLKAAYDQGGCMIVLGEAGQGKTRLIQEFATQLLSPPRLLLSVCRPSENHLTLQPIMELLRHNIQPDEWLQLSPAWASQLTLLLPELTTMRPDLEKPLVEFAPEAAPGQARALLMEAVRQVFLLMSKNQRVLFCFDNAQWADEATLKTLSYLLERPPFDQRASLILTARNEVKDAGLDELMSSLRQSAQVQILQLSPLNREAIAEITGYFFSNTPGDDFVSRLEIDTGGNPLFVLETLRALLAKDSHPNPTHAMDFPLAESVQTMIRSRLDQVTPAARKLLETAAIIGVDFDPELLAFAGQVSEQALIPLIEELEDRMLIEASNRSNTQFRYRFIHNQIREVLLQDVNPLQARLLHSHIAHALELRQKGNTSVQAAVLASHFEQAGEMETAFRYWFQAGQRARRLFSAADTIQSFTRAEQLIEQAPGLPDQLIYELYVEWSDLAYELEDAAMIQRINQNLLQIGREHNKPLLIGAAMDGFSHACMVNNQFEEGLAYTDQAISYLEQSEHLDALMEAYNHRGVFLTMLNQMEKSVTAFQDALSLSMDQPKAGSMRARGNAHYHTSVILTIGGFPERGLKHALLALSDFRTLNRTHGQVTAYSAMALARYFLGDHEQGCQDCIQGLKLAEKIGAWRMRGYLHAYLSMLQMASGDLDACIQNAESAIELGERYDHNETSAAGYRFFGDLYFWLQQYDVAAPYYRKAVELSQGGFTFTDNQFRLGTAQAMAGQVEAGLKLLQETAELAQRTGIGSVVVSTMLGQALIYTRLNEHGQAYQAAIQTFKETQRRKIASLRSQSQVLLGRIALHADDIPNAIQHLESAVQDAAQMHYPWIEIQGQVLLHHAHCLENRPNSVHAERTRALLQGLADTVTRSPFRQAFQEYRQRVEANLI